MAAHGVSFLRVSLGIVFLWFGGLKLVPGLSPAEGLAGATMHKANECVPVADIHRLADIYLGVLDAYFQNPPS